MKYNVGIVGVGNIGPELIPRIKSKGWRLGGVMNTRGIYTDIDGSQIGEARDYGDWVSDLDLIFLAIPTRDKGQTALKYIETALDSGVSVVTCEKGALSNYYSRLRNAILEGRLGFSATVGGGSRLLRYIRERNTSGIEEVHAVVNGTLNYIFSGLSEGRSLGELVEEAKKLGYSEPGASHPLEVINEEATGDVPMKAAILFNTLGLTKRIIRARDIKTRRIPDGQLTKILREAVNRRYIVSITKKRDNEEDVIWGFRYEIGGWHISAGFKHVEGNPLFKKLIPGGVDNALLVSEGEFGKDGSYILTGPGAGPSPTANSMILDAERI